MNLPTVNEWNPALDMIREFRGYDHRPVILPGEWYAMENLTSAHYPLMAPRQRRTKWRTLTKPNGLFAREKLMWVDGTDFYYNGYPQGTVEDSKKQFVAMGAYILIFPDKVYFNTGHRRVRIFGAQNRQPRARVLRHGQGRRPGIPRASRGGHGPGESGERRYLGGHLRLAPRAEGIWNGYVAVRAHHRHPDHLEGHRQGVPEGRRGDPLGQQASGHERGFRAALRHR